MLMWNVSSKTQQFQPHKNTRGNLGSLVKNSQRLRRFLGNNPSHFCWHHETKNQSIHQGSLYDTNPNNAPNHFREILQNNHRFVYICIVSFRPKRVPFHDPWPIFCEAHLPSPWFTHTPILSEKAVVTLYVKVYSEHHPSGCKWRWVFPYISSIHTAYPVCFGGK